MSADTREPDGLTVELVANDHDQFAKLSWAPVDFEKRGVLGYVLYADYASEGNVLRLSSVPLIKSNEYNYKLKDPLRDSYTFRIAEMRDDRKIGPYAEVSLNIPQRSQ